MRLKWDGIPDTEGFEPDTNPDWMPLAEPSPLGLQGWALMLGSVVAIPLYILLDQPTTGLSASDAEHTIVTLMIAVVLLNLLIVFHELTHALLHPGSGRSDDTVLGLSMEHMIVYAWWLGEWSRAQIVCCLLAPFVVVTLILTWVQYLFPTSVVPVVAFVHTMMSAGDLVGVIIVLCNTPSRSILRNQGYYTWWRHGS